MSQKTLQNPVHREWTAGDGSVVSIRRITPGDVELLRAFVKGMSPGSRYFRYGRMDVDVSDNTLRHVCENTEPHSIHLLVVHRDRNEESVVASGRVSIDPTAHGCELEYAVTDAWQRRGVGRRLVTALLEWARLQGGQEVRARVLATNRGGLEFLRRNGFRITGSEGSWLKIATRSLLDIDPARDC